MRYCARVVRPYNAKDGGVVDITTRANIQLRGMPLEDCADVVRGLQAIGLTSLMSGLDNLRNMVGSPIAGIDPLEAYDTRALCKRIDDWYSGNGQGNPEWCNMPRKVRPYSLPYPLLLPLPLTLKSKPYPSTPLPL